MALSTIDQVRLLVQDNEPALYVISDDEVNFLLQRSNGSVNRAAIEAAKIILLKLARTGDSQVDIFSIKGAKAAEQYRLALELFLKSPDLNPVLQNTQAYFGGVSKSDMELNNGILDNNLVPSFVSRTESNGRYFD